MTPGSYSSEQKVTTLKLRRKHIPSFASVLSRRLVLPCRLVLPRRLVLSELILNQGASLVLQFQFHEDSFFHKNIFIRNIELILNQEASSFASSVPFYDHFALQLQVLHHHKDCFQEVIW